jgi:Ion channel
MTFWKRLKVSGDQRFFFLFLFLLADLVIYPYAGENKITYQWFRLFGAFVTLLCVYAVSFRRSTLIVAVLLAVPVGLHRIILPVDLNPSTLAMIGLMLGVVFDVFILVIIFRRVIRAKTINSAAIFGALCVYLIAGFAFARLYFFLTALQPGAFYLDPAINHHTVPTSFDLVYYSFTTMTSLGAAGISPVSQPARSLTLLESILGVLYLAVLVSRLVTSYRSSDSSD